MKEMREDVSPMDITNPKLSVVDAGKPVDERETVSMAVARPPMSRTIVPATPTAAPPTVKKAKLPNPKELANVKMASLFQERCRQLGLSIFFGEETKVSSLGVTSSINGEGKSFMTRMLANILAEDIENPITLLECNWEHPCFHEYFDVNPVPGLAEWLRGECDESAIRYQVSPHLTVIPAGNGHHDAVKLLQVLKKNHVMDGFLHGNGLLIVDLPPVITSAYGTLAASAVDSLILVIHAGITTNLMVSETLTQLKNVPIHGVVLNQMKSRIPRWIRRLL